MHQALMSSLGIRCGCSRRQMSCKQPAQFNLQLNCLGNLGSEVKHNHGLLAAGYLVFFMHCNFVMLSISCVRVRLAKHISMLILVDACVSGVAFYIFGWASHGRRSFFH